MNNPNLTQLIQSTRYQGSKRKLIPWIYDIIKNIEFDSVLDVFGGTGVVSYLFKKMNKRVVYNDYLEFNQQIGISLIENQKVLLEENDITNILGYENGHKVDNGIITTTFKNIYYKEKENIWLDNVVNNILRLNSYDSSTLKYKRAIAYNALFQSCLVKRPFNLFHRKNLVLRNRKVERTFGNKTTWERPFEDLFQKFVKEINSLVIQRRDNCKAICKTVTEINSKGMDMVYLDPPYLENKRNNETANYFKMYHFLEGMMQYKDWETKIDKKTKNRRLLNYKDDIFKKDEIYGLYDTLFEKFKGSIIVLSYKTNGIPSISFFIKKLKLHGKKVRVYSKEYSYSLKKNNTEQLDREYLIIAE